MLDLIIWQKVLDATIFVDRFAQDWLACPFRAAPFQSPCLAF
jgi:hypothetical protein